MIDKDVVWLTEHTLVCSKTATVEDVKAGALAAGMRSDKGQEVQLIALTQHDLEIRAHLEWWGYKAKMLRALGETSIWGISPARD